MPQTMIFVLSKESCRIVGESVVRFFVVCLQPN